MAESPKGVSSHKYPRRRAGRTRIRVKDGSNSSAGRHSDRKSGEISFDEKVELQSSSSGRSIAYTIRSGLKAALSAITLDNEDCLFPDPDSEAEFEEHCAQFRAAKDSKAGENGH